MITVKFFGLICFDCNIRQLIVKEGTVKQVLNQVMQSCPNISEQRLSQAIMFVNKQHINGNKRFSVLLKDGDELALLSPSSGG
ncbi:MoaD/ThiS family protein [Desulfosporosinus sp.]|uniref:MoaD/ThiS family protein n=1 Tax=Desulfosporosinus sp. TaxID=157907 RepID=UPI00232030A0|nr:MoaD/ThiS family protein [Desulfosporosinus sp.]MDA8222182.1 MoaD/ThiS family protein [Desulfitobacterium hafniense]